MKEGQLALELAATIRHDGDGGVADDLSTPDGMAAWLRARPLLLDAAGLPSAAGAAAALGEAGVGAEVGEQVLAVRAALRALLARAVSPAPPSRADAHRLLPADQAVARLNAAAAGQPVVPQLDWPAVGAPAVRLLAAGTAAPPASGSRSAAEVAVAEVAAGVRLAAVLARAAIGFLAGPDLVRLRACTAPRCVRYFLKEHGRQEFCKPSCGNRARAARHYQRHHGAPAD
ncbi:CGNR zinc finger domain-containing protein [Kitasatospora sp. NBC_01302]|uniref:CGNR zinc finger domain-containing protein n=1 Tax=Kitasatospora sp. NBC_01302 TaxID=2903575 RepID=UPI002E0EA464|nr:CGNR zinc finger domain-containing protein [Kitasatospora sp. NBC_01302]